MWRLPRVVNHLTGGTARPAPDEPANGEARGRRGRIERSAGLVA